MTYSIVAVDPAGGAHGVAVASKALCVGAHVPWGEAGVGAVATQAWHDLRYGVEGRELLLQGLSPAAVVAQLTHGDDDAPHRQLGIVAGGSAASYTGSRCLPWAGGMCGNGYAVQGNLLAGPQVVEAMAAEYERRPDLSFTQRLVAALLAGDRAGGDRRGRQSAAVRIWGGGEGHKPGNPAPVVDLRVDDAPLPVHGLARLLGSLWLEYTPPAEVLPWDDSVRHLVGGLLEAAGAAPQAPGSDVARELERWANEQNLETRMLTDGVDQVVLDVLREGREPVLARYVESLRLDLSTGPS
jgi:uncharacterized Ntn-hydrolase superfamily protein